MATGSRSPELIRQSIEETRRELAFSVNDLRSKIDGDHRLARPAHAQPQHRARGRGGGRAS